MILNVILFSIIIVLTVAVGLWFLIDYKHAKAGKKSILWKKNKKHKSLHDSTFLYDDLSYLRGGNKSLFDIYTQTPPPLTFEEILKIEKQNNDNGGTL